MNLAGFSSAGDVSIYDRLASDAQSRQKLQDIQRQQLIDALQARQVAQGAMGDIGVLQPGARPPGMAPAAGGQQAQPGPQPSQGGGQPQPAGGGLYPPGVAAKDNVFMGGGGQPDPAPQQGSPAAREAAGGGLAPNPSAAQITAGAGVVGGAPQQQAQAPQRQQGGQPPQEKPGSELDLRNIARGIMKANPQIDWRQPKNQIALLKAAQQTQSQMLPIFKEQHAVETAQLKQELAVSKLENQMQQFDAKMEQSKLTQLTAAEKLQLQQQLMDAKRENLQMVQAGIDRNKAADRDSRLDLLMAKLIGTSTENDKKRRGKVVDALGKYGAKIDPAATTEELESQLGEAEKGKEERTQAGKLEVEKNKPAAAGGMQGVNAQIRVISSKIRDMYAGGLVTQDDIRDDPAKKAEYDRLVKQRDDLVEAAAKAGVKTEPFDAGKPKKEEAAPTTSALPADLPSPKGLADGTTAKDKDGKAVAVIKNGAWATP